MELWIYFISFPLWQAYCWGAGDGVDATDPYKEKAATQEEL